MNNKILYLIDGNSYLYRAYHAIKGLSTSTGVPSNAVYGFVNMLLKLLKKHNPWAVVVAFDSSAPTKRHRLYEEYKAHRPSTPSDLILQIPYVRQILRAMDIPIIEREGYEADDILATLAKRASSEGYDVFVVTQDKDILQLINSKVRIYDPAKDKVIDRDYLLKHWELPPERIPELMALTGDSTDNIPGIKGVGKRTALKLLKEYSLEDIIENPELIRNERLRRMISNQIDQLKISLKLVSLDYNVPVEIDFSHLSERRPDYRKLMRIFRDLEFKNFIRLLPDTPFNIKEEPLTGCLDKGTALAISIEFGRKPSVYIAPDEKRVNRLISDVDRNLEALLLSHPVTGYRMKELIKYCIKKGIRYDLGFFDDIEILYYLLNPNRTDSTLEEIILEEYNLKVSEGVRGAREAHFCKRLRGRVLRRIKEKGLQPVYEGIERPLLEVLAEMELRGIKVDREEMKSLSRFCKAEMNQLASQIYELSGEEFNINSPQQLSKVLFEKIGLKPLKKTKKGYSTDTSVLTELSRIHPLPGLILRYRSLSKLKSTYLDGLLRYVNPETGRVNTTFSQTSTATGRLSSSDPNLQNIPIRGQWGEWIRRAFVPEQGFVLLSADYSQIELRILAHLSKDSTLIEAFRAGRDIHQETAERLFLTTEITPEMRRIAKAVNFGIVYGITPQGLSDTTGTTVEKAKEFIEKYLSLFPGVKDYAERIIKEARELGYVKTLFGRIRPIPEINSPLLPKRKLGERMALNSPVQGTAADIIKIAMCRINKRLKGLRSALILQIHDELLFEVSEQEIPLVKEIVKEEMESVIELVVPLKVNIGVGINWAEAHA